MHSLATFLCPLSRTTHACYPSMLQVWQTLDYKLGLFTNIANEVVPCWCSWIFLACER